MAAAVTALIVLPLASQGSGAAVGVPILHAATETKSRLPLRVPGGETPLASTSASAGHVAGIAVEGSVRPCPSAQRAVRFYTRRLAEHRARMGAGDAGPERRLRYATPCPHYLAVVLQRKARAARRAYERWFERLYEKWRCIHEHEGRWDDPNLPHYGGLQFDDDFQRAYGPEFFRRWGDAGNWPVYAQLLAAERAYRTRGFHPWPNTARACGLL